MLTHVVEIGVNCLTMVIVVVVQVFLRLSVLLVLKHTAILVGAVCVNRLKVALLAAREHKKTVFLVLSVW